MSKGDILKGENKAEVSDLPKKRFGMYPAKEIDVIIANMRRQQETLKGSYQDRFEEQRMGLLSVSRERDEYKRKLDELEERSMNFDSLEIENADLKKTLEKLKNKVEENERISEEYDGLQKLISEQNSELTVLREKAGTMETQLNQERALRLKSQEDNVDLKENIERLKIKSDKKLKAVIQRYRDAMGSHISNLKHMTEVYEEYMGSLDQVNGGNKEEREE